MRILILTDSLGLPRITPSPLSAEQTWMGLLKLDCKDCELIQMSAGGFTTTDLLEQTSYYSCYQPDIVVIQMGVVDCVPRAIKQDEVFLKRIFQIVSKINNKLGRKFFEFFRTHRSVSYVDIDKFERNVRSILMEFSCPVFWISITSATLYKEILPGVDESIFDYNQMLKKIIGSNYIDCTSLDDAGFMSDGHHLNVIGHSDLYHLVKSRIKNEF